MRVKMFIAGMVAVIGLSGLSMAANKTEVPKVVKDAFSNKYPSAQKVKWEMEEAEIYEAEFKFSGKKMSANFKADGTWLETEAKIKTKDLPKAVKDAIAAKFPGYELERAEQMETPEWALAYEVRLENEEEEIELSAVFSEDGMLLKKNIVEEHKEHEKGHEKKGEADDDDGRGK